VAYQVARALRAPLDVWVARDITLPGRPSATLGAVSEGGYAHLHANVPAAANQSEQLAAIQATRQEVLETARRWRAAHEPCELRGRCVILIDDGLASGAALRATVHSLRDRSVKSVVLATPITSLEVARLLEPHVNELVTLREWNGLGAIGAWYEELEAVTDREIVRLLALAHRTPCWMPA
jgi:putative phosphoribosyl transferase